MGLCTVVCWVSRSSCPTVRYSTTSLCFGRTIQVRPHTHTLNLATPLRFFIRFGKGYDLKQLFIGAEGTLGIITGVSILTPPAPQSTNNVILALPKFDNVLPLFKTTRQHLSEILSAFEFIDRTAYDLAVKHGQGKALSDEELEGAECFVLLETSGGKGEHDEEVTL